MPGPGGGSHGGGFGGGHGGGGFGGGHGGGGFHGGGFHHGPRGYRPGGCLFFPFYAGGGCAYALIMPILCIALAIFLVVQTVVGGFGTLFGGGKVTYNERKMQDYANSQYQMLFDPSSATYEDNVLVVLLTNEDGKTYYCIGWVGDNLMGKVQELFGNEYTKLGNAVQSSVNTSGYQYSLGSNLAAVAEKMQAAVEALDNGSVYRTQKADTHVPGKVWNRSKTVTFNTDTVDAALEQFTATTDITMSFVVADSADVFGKTLDAQAIFALLLAVALVVIAVICVVRLVKRRGEHADDWR